MKITSGRWLARYSIAASAVSALSTSISYLSSMRARNNRADLESSTMSARFAPMLRSKHRTTTVTLECSAEQRDHGAVSRRGDAADIRGRRRLRGDSRVARAKILRAQRDVKI